MQTEALSELHTKAMEAAQTAGRIENAKLGPEATRGFDCGFAWVEAPSVKLNTKLGKALRALGWDKGWGPGAVFLSPSRQNTQSVGVHYAAAKAYAEVMTAGGVNCFPNSRLD